MRRRVRGRRLVPRRLIFLFIVLPVYLPIVVVEVMEVHCLAQARASSARFVPVGGLLKPSHLLQHGTRQVHEVSLLALIVDRDLLFIVHILFIQQLPVRLQIFSTLLHGLLLVLITKRCGSLMLCIDTLSRLSWRSSAKHIRRMLTLCSFSSASWWCSQFLTQRRWPSQKHNVPRHFSSSFVASNACEPSLALDITALEWLHLMSPELLHELLLNRDVAVPGERALVVEDFGLVLPRSEHA